MILLQFFSELIPCLGLGYLIGRFKPDIASQIVRPLVQLGVPISLMGLLLKSGLDWSLLEALLMALMAIGLLIGLIKISQRFGKL